MITVHHLNNSRSQRILWMLEELSLPYELTLYERDVETMLAPDALKSIHPLGKSPVLVDDNNSLAESGAIIEYLGRVYGDGNLRPNEDSQEHLNYQYWLHFSEGTMMPPLLLMLIMQKVREKAQPFFLKPIAHAITAKVAKNFITPNITRQLAFIETHLKVNEWFAGENLTGADIQMSFPLEASVFRGLCENYPAIKDYVARIQKREAYQTALKKGGEYVYA